MRRRAGAALLVGLALAGCSQVDALAPVGGNRLAEVRFAALDVLLDAEVELLTAPVCTMAAADAVECAGTRADGAAITVSAPAGDPLTMTVLVDGTRLWSGSVAAVLDAAAEGRPVVVTS